MSTNAYFAQLATYNQWMNRKLYEAAAALPEAELQCDRGAFFGSIFGTLNHIAIGHILWFKRIALYLPGLASLKCVEALPPPGFPNLPLHPTLAGLDQLRTMLDEAIIAFCAVFNHQTHHRGQATTLFSQMGIDVGATDLLLLLPDAP